MPVNQPLLRLRRAPRDRRRIPGRKPLFPSKRSFQEQAERHSRAFARIEADLARLEQGSDFSDDPARVAPDRALVFEVIGPVSQFADAARAVGFEWLAEQASRRREPAVVEEPAPETAAPEPDLPMRRLYLTMPTESSLNQMLTRWRRFTAGERKPDSEASPKARQWWDLFAYLEDVRAWSVEDRVSSDLAGYLERERERRADRRAAIELDLWYRASAADRRARQAEVEALIEEHDGVVLDAVEIAEIGYHALLVELPSDIVAEIAGYRGRFATAQGLERIRPQSIARLRPPTEWEEEAAAEAADGEEPTGEPIAALLDGYPIAGHELLAGRIDVDEVDIVAADAPVADRYHGTAMASLIIHGDRHSARPALSRPLKVVPILTVADEDGAVETTPRDQLPLGVVFRAVTAMMEGLDGNAALAPSVSVINHSICDCENPFAQAPSYWAKLLDFLSHRYRVLFVVSAGNIEAPIEIPGYDSAPDFDAAPVIERRAAILNALERSKGVRGLLSPAEAVNALTVGAVHDDGAGECPAGHLDPFPNVGMTNICSALGLGVNRSVKPDFVEAGGRQLALIGHDGASLFTYVNDTGLVGQLAAAPDPYGGSLSATRMSSGTSNAAALTTRAAALLAEMLDDEFAVDGRDFGANLSRAAILKALLVHGCAWGSVGEVLNNAFPPPEKRKWSRRRETISRFLGFGQAVHARVMDGQSHRATMLADDVLAHGQLHEYRIPIPGSMIRNRELRRMILTLAWTTPVRATQAYRDVALELVNAHGARAFWRGVKTVPQPHPDAMRRGTVMHLVLEGQNLIRELEEAEIFVGVQARALHDLGPTEAAPYALAVTMELAESARANVYAEVQAALVAARARASRR